MKIAKTKPGSILLLAVIWTTSAVAAQEVVLTDAEKVRAVLNWLDCDECFESQYDYLISLGPQMKETLEAAQNNLPPFKGIIDARQDAYKTNGRKVAAVRLGLSLTSRDPGILTQLDLYAVDYAKYFIEGDLNRYKRKATKALENLSRKTPSRNPKRRSP